MLLPADGAVGVVDRCVHVAINRSELCRSCKLARRSRKQARNRGGDLTSCYLALALVQREWFCASVVLSCPLFTYVCGVFISFTLLRCGHIIC